MGPDECVELNAAEYGDRYETLCFVTAQAAAETEERRAVALGGAGVRLACGGGAKPHHGALSPG